MRIGIYAGTFDPVHIGHTAFATAAINQAALERVIIVAEKEPYRKKPHASWDHRQAMIERATQDIENVDHDYQFAAQLAHRHTMMDMLEAAHAHYGEDNEYWFLVGSDIFEHMHKWQDIISEAEYGGFVVALRDNNTDAWLHEKSQVLQLNPAQMRVIENTQPYVSSSKIREAARLRQPVGNISGSVQNYINLHQLYT